MKTLITICLIGAFVSCQGQEKHEETTLKKQQKTMELDTTKQMNILDEKVKIFDKVFTLAGAGEDNPLGGATNYLELIEKMDAPEDLKQQIREIYDLYDTSLDPKKKEELKIKVSKMLQEGIDKSMIEQQK